MTKKGWFWLIFLILLVTLVVVLATRYNVISIRSEKDLVEPILGSIGFLVILTGLIFFFVRLAQEMHLSHMQSEFLAAVTHELKTPIATLELSTALLRGETPLTAEERERLWNSHQMELKRLRQEVEMLLEAARWDAKAFRLSQVEIDLRDWMIEQRPRWQQILGEGSELTLDPGSVPLRATADERILNLIAENLVENARKFAHGRAHLEVRAVSDDDEWTIVFRDHGWGFSSEDAKKIFKRFYRSRTFAPYSIPGSGLGLYLARSAAKRMKMKLTAASPGREKGSSFALQGKLNEVTRG